MNANDSTFAATVASRKLYENDSIELDIFWFCSLSEEKTFSYFFTMQASHLKNKLIARVCMGFLTRFSREFRAK